MELLTLYYVTRMYGVKYRTILNLCTTLYIYITTFFKKYFREILYVKGIKRIKVHGAGWQKWAGSVLENTCMHTRTLAEGRGCVIPTLAICAWIPLACSALTAASAHTVDSKSTNP